MDEENSGAVFYVVIEGRPSGPYRLEELKSMRLKPTDFVKAAGMPEYKELREISSLSHILGVRHQPTPPQYYATMDVRLLAWGIDSFISTFIYGIIATVYLIGSNPEDPQRIPTLLLGALSIPIIKFLLGSFMEGMSQQASPGKMLIGIRVTDLQGRPIGLGRALIRNLSKLIGVLTLGLGFLSGFLDKKQQCLHDKVAGTLVVKARLI